MAKECHFFQAGNCRSGSNCRFSHTPSGQSPGRSFNFRPPNLPGASSPLPSGACRYYWATGRCKWEFECRFQHVQCDDSPLETTAQSPRLDFLGQEAITPFFTKQGLTKINGIAPFLTEQGLAKINGIATDGFFEETSMSPTDVHDRLRRFLSDTFRFTTSFEVYAFLTPLSSANRNNPLWTQEEGQLLLDAVTSPNGSLRITEIINWPKISIRAGLDRQIVSFQRGILLLLQYLSSEFVVKSTRSTQTNHFFSIILKNFEKFADSIEECMNAVISVHSFEDTRSSSPYKYVDIRSFVSIAGVLHEFLVRFKNAVATYPRLGPLVNNLNRWFQDWRAGVEAIPPLFDNSFNNISPAVREHVIDSIRDRINCLVKIVQREEPKLIKSDFKQKRNATVDVADRFGPALHTTYEGHGPGHLRHDGPRHDNDFAYISEIRIAPTDQELKTRIPPFLPGNFFAAPHPAPEFSMERLLDIQFRLLREELTAPLRQAVHALCDDLESRSLKKTKLGILLDKKGGKYHGQADSYDSLMFNVYSGVNFLSLEPGWKGISTSLLIDTPPGLARADSRAQRANFWASMSGKRLSQGGLIALVWDSEGDISVHLGIIASSSGDISDYVQMHKDHIKLQVVFFDPSLEWRILQDLQNDYTATKGIKILVESAVMFEAIRPFLEALKEAEPEDIPFSRYLVLQPPEILELCVLEAPRYARLPNFQFCLDSLFPEEAEVENLTLSVTDPVSINHARKILKSKSRLDPSQADSVIDTLTREVALIQGPPGTGKSFTGVEIIRVLMANKVGPILLIALTNHALDHMLSSILDAKITNKIVRLGRRSTDPRMEIYSIGTLEERSRSRFDRAFLADNKRELKEVESEIRDFMDSVPNLDIDNRDRIMKYLSKFYPEHFEYLFRPPPWVSNVKEFLLDEVDGGGEWQTAGRGGKARVIDQSTYAFWRDCSDLAFIGQVTNEFFESWKSPTEPEIQTPQNSFSVQEVQEPDNNHNSDEELSDTEGISEEEIEVEESWKTVQLDPPIQAALSETSTIKPPSSVDYDNIEYFEPEPTDAKDMDGFFDALGFERTPSVPHSDRPLDELLEGVGNVWEMSAAERQKTHIFWAEQARNRLGLMYMHKFQRLRKLHAFKLRQCKEDQEEARRNLLHYKDIIGCTTTGAAQLTSLLNGLNLKVLLVEEAGQVMEAHILGSLVPSIEHLILIGDPLQLRPTVNNYALSVENKRGQIYKLDMSLMERLSTSGFPMSRIDVQRRMRPMISSLIRNTLYPGLEDHKLVQEYPDVRGLRHNVFFVSHNHRENEGGDDSASKYNMYEVAMIRDLVLYLLRQGCYSNEGDIVVLCAYIGQLARLRDALAQDVAISIDERDQAALADQEREQDQDVIGEATIERVNVTKRVRLRTVDNYQGEEGRIVILSLVRNSGDPDDEDSGRPHRANIGFLKSENRTNVALSRAREGLYIFGHAQNLSSRSTMWGKIVEELEEKGLIGPALPIACHCHSDVVKYVSEPGQLPQMAPDGGCLENCEFRLNCGHLCPFKCHCDDPKHVAVICSYPCPRLCARDHPCRKQCGDECGRCQFPIANVQLPCGHTKASVPCWKLDSLEDVYCDFEMEKNLPSCEHIAVIPCGRDPLFYRCYARCDRLMECCSKICLFRCHECQAEAKNVQQEDGKVSRIQHRPHPCEKIPQAAQPSLSPPPPSESPAPPKTQITARIEFTRVPQPAALRREKCSSNHEHTKKCMEYCRQSCKHARAHSRCSDPCAPCREPCGWNCGHYSCPVPCGSICVRLPCDKPCKKPLKCGHACPSVCGEDCEIQVCPECAESANQKTQVVDLSRQRSLKDVLPESGNIDQMIITIPACRHVFTVETLDKLTGMNKFYSQDEQNAKWTGLLVPIGFTKSPTCPTCRSPITCPRYGRIFKRADLDILERNVATHMSQSLEKRQKALKAINKNILKNLLAAEAARITIPDPKDPSKLAKALTKQKSSRKKLLEPGRNPVSERNIQASDPHLHFIDSKVSLTWRKVTHKFFAVYSDIVNITERRYAHTQAWEASLSLLFEREIEAELENPSTLPRNPQEHAMKMARIYIGQPRPLADRRFLVEAFWMTLHIRLTLIGLAQTWMCEVKKRQRHYPAFHLQQWVIYIDFLLQTCVRDAEKAYDIAKDSESHRQIAKSRLLRMHIDLEVFRFNLSMCRHYGTFKDIREDLLAKVNTFGDEAKAQIKDTVTAHLVQKGAESLQQERVWLEDNFISITDTIVSEWVEMKQSIKMDTFYQPLSLDKQMKIVYAMDFASTGDFYQCANGHTLVITECGGDAMERSRCPECGGVIGGSEHTSNARFEEFDRLAQTLNSSIAQSPWENSYR